MGVRSNFPVVMLGIFFFFLSRIYPLYVGAPNFLSLIFLWVACVELGVFECGISFI